MAHRVLIQVAVGLALFSIPSPITETIAEPIPSEEQPALTTDQHRLIDFATGRFEAQGLELPEVEFIFHDSLFPCHGHKGLYWKDSNTLEMCSMDEHTMLHELAHAWANIHLDVDYRDDFVGSRGLDSWNDHEHEWAQRGTEHVAETIAWALGSEPKHVRWVEDGITTHRLLTLSIDVETLLANFTELTGAEPIFRHADEWQTGVTAESFSPEARLGG